mmetsp:Transcript_17293/g.46883  ORF Transcript_17293/g.46883 Transcript_17293/m.46883 type:complete len:133 (+) Transcript_17293:217-615(+)
MHGSKLVLVHSVATQCKPRVNSHRQWRISSAPISDELRAQPGRLCELVGDRKEGGEMKLAMRQNSGNTSSAISDTLRSVSKERMFEMKAFTTSPMTRARGFFSLASVIESVSDDAVVFFPEVQELFEKLLVE